MRRAGSDEDYADYLGWSLEVQVLADVFDAIYDNARIAVSPHSKKQIKPFPPYPGRPTKKKKATVKDLFSKFQKAGVPIHGG